MSSRPESIWGRASSSGDARLLLITPETVASYNGRAKLMALQYAEGGFFMPSNHGVSFPDASYNYRRGIRRPVVPVPVSEETASSCEDAAEAAALAAAGCGCGSGIVPVCGGGCPNGSCGQDSDVPVYDCNCQKEISYRLCCDPNGCCCKYPCSWRNPFWPEFAHPRWLCCKDLYNVRD